MLDPCLFQWSRKRIDEHGKSVLDDQGVTVCDTAIGLIYTDDVDLIGDHTPMLDEIKAAIHEE